jgi:hypothetical protein
LYHCCAIAHNSAHVLFICILNWTPDRMKCLEIRSHQCNKSIYVSPSYLPIQYLNQPHSEKTPRLLKVCSTYFRRPIMPGKTSHCADEDFKSHILYTCFAKPVVAMNHKEGCLRAHATVLLSAGESEDYLNGPLLQSESSLSDLKLYTCLLLSQDEQCEKH